MRTIVSRNDRVRQCAHIVDFKKNQQKTKSRITVLVFNCASIGEEGIAAEKEEHKSCGGSKISIDGAARRRNRVSFAAETFEAPHFVAKWRLPVIVIFWV